MGSPLVIRQGVWGTLVEAQGLQSSAAERPPDGYGQNLNRSAFGLLDAPGEILDDEPH